MFRFNSFQWKPLVLSLLISLGAGGLSAWITSGSMDIYNTLNQPALAPPSWIFPVVWTILYILMGISAYLIYTSDKELKKTALIIYALQLFVNILWPFLFFNLQNFLFAFVWLVLLWILVIIMVVLFCKVNKTAAYLQIPYFLWITFAGYLNLAVYLLNS